MSVIDCDRMIEKLPAAAADPAFRDPVLPGLLYAGTLRREPGRFQELNDTGVEFGVAVENDENDEPVRKGVGESLAELLNDPLGCRLRCHIEMQDTTAAVLDDEEAVQQLKRDRRNRKKVEGYDCLAVIVEKRKPTLCRIASAAHSPQVLTYSPFGTMNPSFSNGAFDYRLEKEVV
jgi:hypothetical protein